MRLIVFLFMTVVTLFASTSAGAAPLHDASKKGDTAGVLAALDGGADANQSNGLATPLYYAAAGGHVPTMEVLLARGANADVPSIWGPPLMAAVSADNIGAVKLLLGAGANPNGHFKTRTALHVAAQNGFLACVEALVEAGADVNAQTLLTETPVHLAKRYQHDEVAAYLMAHGVILPKPPAISSRLAAGDMAKGQQIYALNCERCHFSGRGGGYKVGPALWGVVGRDKAATPGGGTSNALLAWGGAWTYEDLNTYLYGPMVTTPGVLMEVAGIPEEAERIDLIAYLRSLSDSPLPLPEH